MPWTPPAPLRRPVLPAALLALLLVSAALGLAWTLPTPAALDVGPALQAAAKGAPKA